MGGLPIPCCDLQLPKVRIAIPRGRRYLGSVRRLGSKGDWGSVLADVTIGLAVYNGASTVAAAIESLLAQTYRGLTLVIADNGSTDETPAICQRYARHDERIRYNRFDETIPVAENYQRLLAAADTPFFMWAAADDLWAPDFVATHRAFLLDSPDYVLSQSRVIFVTAGRPSKGAGSPRLRVWRSR